MKELLLIAVATWVGFVFGTFARDVAGDRELMLLRGVAIGATAACMVVIWLGGS